MNLHTFLGALVGVIIFIHGIRSFSHELLVSSGERFRNIFRKATKNRFTAGLSGTLVTGIIQSSTAATVITISLVSAGVISFGQSLGIILGANVGTTITAQLVAFKVTAYAPIFIIAGFLLSLIGKNYKYLGKGLFYFGLVFFGLNLITEAIEPIKNDPTVLEVFAAFTNPYAGFLVGLLFTAIVHSSSVSTGIVVVLASSGIIQLEQGIPILLGTNIGSTITALYTSVALSSFAKRAAVAHTIFNIVGVLLIWPFIEPFTHLISNLGGTNTQQIANAHTIFNVGIATLFLVLIKPYQKLIERIVPSVEEEILLVPKYLVGPLPDSNKQAFKLIEQEVSYLLLVVHKLYLKTISYLKAPRNSEKNTIEKYEVLVDLLDEKIEKSLLHISQGNLTENEAKRIVLLVRISNLTEQLADTAKSLSIIGRSLSTTDLELSKASIKTIDNLYARLNVALDALQKTYPKKIEEADKLYTKLDSVPAMVTRAYNEHVKRMKNSESYSGSAFVESTSLIENGAGKVRDIIKLSQSYSRLKK